MTERSFNNSAKLFERTMKDFEIVIVNGEATGSHPVELDRVKMVMVAIAHALAYRDFGRQFIGECRVFCASFKFKSKEPTSRWDKLRRLVEGGGYATVKTSYPEVFEYGIHKTKPHGFICRLIFYGAFVVYAWPVIKGEAPS